MAKVGQIKRKLPNIKTAEGSSRASSPDLKTNLSFHCKRKRFSSSKLENESSTDSFSYSNYIPSASEDSSDSDFEEHAYSRSVQTSIGINHHTISDLGIRSRFTHAKESKRSKCTSKNAVMARLNRLKKKKYIEDLEKKNAELEAENETLKIMLDKKVKDVESLKRKTSNLESVIRNKTEIGSLLRCVRQNTDLEVSSSLMRNQPNTSSTDEVNTLSENPSSRNLQEPEVSLSEEEGNEPMNYNAKSVDSILGFLDIHGDSEIDFDTSNPLLPDVDSWFKPSRFEFPESPESAKFNDFSPSRCETPSKGFAVCENKENLFGDVGVCFHIANKKVSLEFCDSCNHMASL